MFNFHRQPIQEGKNNFLFTLKVIHSKLAEVNLNPEKLLLTKWTAVNPEQKKKHFLVVRVINPETDKHKIEEVEMEAVIDVTSLFRAG